MDHDEIWKYCKILEQNDSGEIILHQNNIQYLIDTWNKIRNGEDSITLVSFIGPKSCGKSFFSNLFIEYVRMQSSLSWTKRIKREGLQGFSYGVEPNVIKAAQLIPEKDSNAIYFYPELLKLSIDQREKFICILHVHHGDRKYRNKKADVALETLLAMMSSVLVNITWHDKNTLSDIYRMVTDFRHSPIKYHLTKNVIHVIRGDGVQENENVIHLEESASLHDSKGLVKLTYQQYSGVNKLMKAISTFRNVMPVQLTLSNILEHLIGSIKIINDCKAYLILSLSNTTVPIKVNEAKLVNDYTEIAVDEKSFSVLHLQDETCRQDPVIKSTEYKLSALYYQIGPSKFGIATLLQNTWESSSAQICTHLYSGEIGILINGTWICGDDVKKFNERGEVQKFWSLEDIFKMDDFSDTIIINCEEISISLSYLLGMFFWIMKQTRENENTCKYGAALISIPFWFSSDKRRQIVEAGKIAGFDNVQLINENTASAYFAYKNGCIPVSEQLVVISENSNRLHISIYSYNKHTKIISLKGQSPIYETTKALLNHCLDNQQENEIRKDAFENLCKMWDLAKSCIQGRFNLYNKSVLVLCESNYWRELLWTFSANITTPGNISVRVNSTLLGLAYIFHASKTGLFGSVKSFIKDEVPLKIVMTHGSQQFLVLNTKYAFLNPETQDFSFELPKSAGNFYFREHDFLSHRKIGKLHLKYTIPPTFNITITFKRNEMGIFVLSSMEYDEIPLCGCGVSRKKPLPEFYFDWQLF